MSKLWKPHTASNLFSMMPNKWYLCLKYEYMCCGAGLRSSTFDQNSLSELSSTYRCPASGWHYIHSNSAALSWELFQLIHERTKSNILLIYRWLRCQFWILSRLTNVTIFSIYLTINPRFKHGILKLLVHLNYFILLLEHIAPQVFTKTSSCMVKTPYGDNSKSHLNRNLEIGT